jgi:hypothetical protein
MLPEFNLQKPKLVEAELRKVASQPAPSVLPPTMNTAKLERGENEVVSGLVMCCTILLASWAESIAK